MVAQCLAWCQKLFGTKPIQPMPTTSLTWRFVVEDGNQLILIDTGMGNKQSEKIYGYYSLWGTTPR
jgi:hypothetical protein